MTTISVDWDLKLLACENATENYVHELQLAIDNGDNAKRNLAHALVKREMERHDAICQRVIRMGRLT